MKITAEDLKDAVDHARTRARELNLSLELVRSDCPTYQGLKPDLYSPLLKVYLKHSLNFGVSPNAKGMRGEPVILLDLTTDTIYDNLKLLIKNDKLFNSQTDGELIYVPNTSTIINARKKDAQEKEAKAELIRQQEKDQKRRLEREAKKIQNAESDKKKEELRKMEAARIAEATHLENLQDTEKKKILDTPDEEGSLEASNDYLRDRKFSNKSVLKKAELVVIKDAYTHYYPSAFSSFSECQMEDAIIMNKEAFGLKDLFLVYRQFVLTRHGRIDLIYRDLEGTLFVIELEVGAVTKDHFSKSLIYRRQLSKDLGVNIQDIKIILIANSVDDTISEECIEQGIQVITKSESDTAQLIRTLPIKKSAYYNSPYSYTPPETPKFNYFKKPWYLKK